MSKLEVAIELRKLEVGNEMGKLANGDGMSKLTDRNGMKLADRNEMERLFLHLSVYLLLKFLVPRKHSFWASIFAFQQR